MAYPFAARRAIATWLAKLLVALLVTSHCWVSFASVVSLSHDPLQPGGGHHAAPGEDAHAAAHSHGESGGEDGWGVQPDEHHAADHSHEKANLPPAHRLAGLHSRDRWHGLEHRPLYPAPHFSFERPPRSLSMK
jgi:hypothetical protein